MTKRNTTQTNVFTIGLMDTKKGNEMVANPWWDEKNYFEESQKTQDLSPLKNHQ